MILKKKVYLDPSVIIAFIDRGHPQHDTADVFFRHFADSEYQLFTDIASIITAYRTIYSSISPSLAKDFLKTIFKSSINIIYPDPSEIKLALKALINYDSTDLTYDKSLIAVLANKRNILDICTLEYLPPLFGQNTFFIQV